MLMNDFNTILYRVEIRLPETSKLPSELFSHIEKIYTNIKCKKIAGGS